MTKHWLRAAAVLSLTLFLGASPAAAAPGDFLGMIGDGPDLPLEYPLMGVGLAADGRIFVNDYYNGDLKVFNPDFTLRESWNETHPDREYPQYPMFLNPHSLTLHGDRVYVAVPAFGAVQAFTLGGEHLFDIGSPVDIPCGWDPSGLATDADGNVYVTDIATGFIWETDPATGYGYKHWCGGQVHVFSAAGLLLRTIGSPGSDPDRFPGSDPNTLAYPQAVAVDRQGQVYVADMHRVVIYAKDGTWLRTIDVPISPDEWNLSMAIAVDRDGRIYLTDWTHTVRVLANDGTPIATWGGIGQEPGQFYVPMGVTLDPAQSRLFVTDMWNHRIQVLEAFPVAACGYAWEGFLPPVSLGKAFEAGSTIPVKFKLADCDGKPVDGAKATLSLRQGGVEVAARAAKWNGRRLTAAESAFISLGDGRYRFNLSTKGLGAGTWTLVVTLDDGTEKTKVIRIK